MKPRKRFVPSVDRLEGRLLLSSAYFSGRNSVASFSSASGKITFNDGIGSAGADVTVGGAYGLSVSPHAGSTYGYAPKVIEVDYSTPNSLLSSGTRYGIDTGMSTPSTETDYVNPNGFLGVPGISRIFDAKQGYDDLQITVKFAPFNGSAVSDDVYKIVADVWAPFGQLDAKFPQDGTPNAYTIGHTNSHNEALPWSSPDPYNFGTGAPGDYPFQFDGTGWNATPINGSFFITQMAIPTNVINSGYLVSSFPITTPYTEDFSQSHWGIDAVPTSNTYVPIAWGGMTYYAAANSQGTPVYTDTMMDNPGSRMLASDQVVPWDFHFNASFETFLCWKGSASTDIPVVISSVEWSITCNYTNTYAKINPSYTAAFTSQVLWVGSSSVSSMPADNGPPRLLPSYGYNVTKAFAITSDVYVPQASFTSETRPSPSIWAYTSPMPTLVIPSAGSSILTQTVPSDGWYSLQFTVSPVSNFTVSIDDDVFFASASPLNVSSYNYTGFPIRLRSGKSYTLRFADLDATGDNSQAVSNIQLVSVEAPAF